MSDEKVRPVLRVVDFPGANLQGVPTGLRSLADLVESDNKHAATIAVVTTVSEFGQVAVYAYGLPVTEMHTIGVLQAAIVELCDIARGGKNA